MVLSEVRVREFGDLLRVRQAIALLIALFGLLLSVFSATYGGQLVLSPLIAVVLMGSAGVMMGKGRFRSLRSFLMLVLIGAILAYVLSPMVGAIAAFLPPLTPLSFKLKPIQKRPEEGEERREKPRREPTILSIPFERERPGMIIICSSPKEAGEAAVRFGLALVGAMYKVVLIDRSGSAVSRLEEMQIPSRIVKPDEMELLYPGELKDSFPSMLASLLAPLTGAIPSLLANVARSGKWDALLRERTTPEILRETLREISGGETFLMPDLMPKVGPLLIDLSGLKSETSREIATLLLLLQVLAIRHQDFVVVASLLRPVQRELMRGTGKDSILQLLCSLASRGAIVSTTFEVEPAAAGCFPQLVLFHLINLPSNRALVEMLRTIDPSIPGKVNKLSDEEGLFIAGRPVKTRKFKLGEVMG